jgi:hypothetical protein
MARRPRPTTLREMREPITQALDPIVGATAPLCADILLAGPLRDFATRMDQLAASAVPAPPPEPRRRRWRR